MTRAFTALPDAIPATLLTLTLLVGGLHKLPAQGAPPTTGSSIPLEMVRDGALRDFQRVGDRLIALAEEIPEAMYDFRPMAGVRSTREVLLLIVAENYGIAVPLPFLTPPREFVDSATSRARLEAIRSKEEIVIHLRRSSTALREGLASFPTARMMAVAFFGPPRPINYMLAALAGDQHEHLGQLIAYARMNGVTPPWSKR